MRTLGLYIMTTLAALIAVALCALLIITAGDGSNAQQTNPTITVEIPGQGALLGNYDETLWTKQIYMQFRGIPYAEAPSGQRRFRAPVAREPWRQILSATDFGKRCPVITTVEQLTPEELNDDLEDCLNLCVYTKNLTAQQPVMFYIYGGGYYNGSAEDHPPKYLLEQDVVLVVPQYRIGALGWLTTYTQQLPGNAPIADILLALDWVQRYISVFGGDPKQVTIFGQSAGAGVASALILSPSTPAGSFQRAIVQSGSIFAGWAIAKSPKAQALRICKLLGCLKCDLELALQGCLLSVNVKKLLELTKGESFSPVIGDRLGILPQQPSELIKHYKRSIPLLTGFTKHDGSFVLAIYYDAMKQNMGNLSALSVRDFTQGILNLVNDTTALTDNLLLRLLYTPKLLASHDHKQALPSYFDLTNDIFMKSPVISLASKLFAKRTAPVYVYSFEYEGAHTRFGYEFGNEHYPFNGGVHHSNDNIYVFSTHNLNEQDTEIAKRMVAIWTSFASTGVPDAGDGTQILALKSEAGPYLRINTHLTHGEDLLGELTATLDDPNNHMLDRPEIEF